MDISSEIIDWYNENKRDLPWRNTTDPYKIWLSEIILQQTRVDQGMSYYLKFVDEFPTVNDLANAPEDKILKLWQGLGYYSRARNLHHSAKTIVEKHDSIFPRDYKDVLALKGVGEYTAAAITSFAYKSCYPVVDGNVFRIITRLYGIKAPIDSTQGKKEVLSVVNELIDKKNPDTFNQAIMEFGALQCSKSPKCESCPILSHCIAYQTNTVNEFPVKSKKIKQTTRYFNFLVYTHNKQTFIIKRTDNDIWKGLFNFPLHESKKPIENISEIIGQDKNQPRKVTKSHSYKHILSHQKIFATFWHLEYTANLPALQENPKLINLKDIKDYPVPKLIENYISSTSIFN